MDRSINRISFEEFLNWSLNDDEVQDFFAIFMKYQTKAHVHKIYDKLLMKYIEAFTKDLMQCKKVYHIDEINSEANSGLFSQV